MEPDMRNASEEDAQNTAKCRLLCDPVKLPAPPRSATKDVKGSVKTKETAIMLKDYFYHAKMRSIKRGVKR